MSEVLMNGMDIGNPAISGHTTRVGSGYDVVAGGRDIWENSDQCHYTFQNHTGDFDFTMRVESLGMPHQYTKAGIMVRSSQSPDSAHVFFFVFPDNSARNKNNGGVEFQYRMATGTDCAAIYPENYTVTPPLFPVNFPQTWLRLKRSGDVYEALYSANGEAWTLYTRYELSLGSTVSIGIAVTSHDEDKTVEAKFRDVVLK